MTSALLVLTGSRVWTMKDGTPHPTGFWAREFMEAYNVFTDGGLETDVATPGGVAAQVDPLSWEVGYNDNDPEFVARQKAFLQGVEAVLLASIILVEFGHGLRRSGRGEPSRLCFLGTSFRVCTIDGRPEQVHVA